jgi:palmitoyl-protein thioesterase
MLSKELPSTHIVSIRVGSNPADDYFKSIFDYAPRQIQEVCQKLKMDRTLSDGFNAIGLSQGGLLMRALVEMCPDLKVNNLITFGSPHQGVSVFPGCADSSGWAKWNPARLVDRIFGKKPYNVIPCSVMNTLIGGSVYSESAQTNILPAQYFKDPRLLPDYLRTNKFLTEINNEKSVRQRINLVFH